MRRRARELGGRLGRFGADYVDVLIAAGLAVYVSYRALSDELTGDALTAATVGLLGALAIVILRERWERAKAVASVERALEVATTTRPWRVLEAQLSWELLTVDGGRALAIAEKELRIEQDDVFSIYEWQSRPVGRVTRHECYGRAKGAPAYRKLPIIYEWQSRPVGRMYRVISLEGVWRRGQRIAYRSERDLEDSFTETRENVSVLMELPTDHVTLTVIWPKDRKPRHIEVERSGRARVMIDPQHLKRAGQGRTKHVEVVADPELGEMVTISWDW